MAISIISSALFILILAGTILVIITDEEDYSEKKIAWILIVSLIPAVGLLGYVIFGLKPKRTRQYDSEHRKFAEGFAAKADRNTLDTLFGDGNVQLIRKEYRELSRLLSHGNGTTVTDNNSLEIITSGKRKMEALASDLENAKNHIHMEYFYFRKDAGSKRIKEILMKKAREGVKVRFIYENIANIDINPGYYYEMKQAGVEIVKFTKPRFNLLRFSAQLNYRDHRKIVVIDGRIGYTGGMNIGDDYFVRWRDTHMRLTGNAVYALQYSFLCSYHSSGGRIDESFSNLFPQTDEKYNSGELIQIVPDEPDNKWPVLHMGAVWTVQHSSQYIYIQTPYFVPPDPLLQALKTAALKGVDIRLMFPAKADLFYMDPANRSYYRECLDAGIRIFEKEGNFIHSKTIVSDDYLSVIGSANMDYRSMELNYEINAYIFSEKTAEENRRIFLKDLEQCREIHLEEWNGRAWYKKLAQATMRLFAPLL